jgi:hypothetical protein
MSTTNTTPTYSLQAVLREPLVNKQGQPSRSFMKWLQGVEQRTATSLSLQGQIEASTIVTGRALALGPSLAALANIEPAVVNINANGQAYLDVFILDGPNTYQRMPIANMDANRRALIDFTQSGHLGKNLANVADDPAGGRAAWQSAAQQSASVATNGNLLLKNIVNIPGATFGASTSSISPVQIPDLTDTITTKGNSIDLSFAFSFSNSTNTGTVICQFYVDANPVGPLIYGSSVNANQNSTISARWIATGLAAGWHTFAVYWYVTAGTTCTAVGLNRSLQIVELG